MPPPILTAFQRAIQVGILEGLLAENNKLHLELTAAETETARLKLEFKALFPIGLTCVVANNADSLASTEEDEVELTTEGVNIVSIIDFFLNENNSLRSKITESKKDQAELRAKIDAELLLADDVSRPNKIARRD